MSGSLSPVVVAVTASGQRGGLAIAVDGSIVHHEVLEEDLVHAREIVGRIARAFEARDLRPDRVGTVVTDVGPGSFTGMRVGVTVAKTVAWSVGGKVVPVLAPDALAYALGNEAGPRAVLIDAKRSELYLARYRIEDGAPKRVEPVRLIPRDTALEATEGDLLLGDGVAALPSEPPADRLPRPEDFDVPEGGTTDDGIAATCPHPATVLRLGLAALRTGGAIAPERIEPFYLRSSDPVARPPKRTAPR